MGKVIRFLLMGILALILLGLPAEAAFAAEDPVPESYQKQDLNKLNKNKKLEFSEGMSKLKISSGIDGGLQLVGTEADFAGARITLKDTFHFKQEAVGRVVVGGCLDDGQSAKIQVYLDDAAQPIAAFDLKDRRGYWLQDIRTLGITGDHTVALGLVVKGKKATDEMTLTLQGITFQEYSVPVVNFHIDESVTAIADMNSSPDHSVKCTGKVDIIVPAGYKSEYSKATFSDMLGLDMESIRGRGNSTWKEPKKPYLFKLNKKKDFFGMGASKRWTLIADSMENSHMRNRITYWLGREMNLEYTPECVPVEVVMNGEYYGSYLLCEQIRMEEYRVNLPVLEEDDTDEALISGGYLLGIGSDQKEDPGEMFNTTGGASFIFRNPDFREYTNKAQRDYIQNYLQKTEDAIFGDGFKDSGGKSYTEYMDLTSTVKYWWIQEFSQNGDAYITDSTYLYKKRDGLLYWGPLWDFDIGWGNLYYDDDPEPASFNYTVHPWLDRLKQDPNFIAEVKKNWGAFDAKLEELVKAGGILDQYYDEMLLSKVNDIGVWGHYASELTSYRDEVEQLRSWINGRRKWIKAHYKELDNLFCDLTFVADGKTVAVIPFLKGTNRAFKHPEAPKKDGYTFLGWYMDNDEKLMEMMGFDESTTFTAQYVKGKIAYNFTNKEPYTWVRGSKKGLEIVAKRNAMDRETMTLFDAVIVDGEEVINVYDLEEGSVRVIFRTPYLEKLKTGKHTLRLTFADGQVDTTFEIKDKADEDTTEADSEEDTEEDTEEVTEEDTEEDTEDDTSVEVPTEEDTEVVTEEDIPVDGGNAGGGIQTGDSTPIGLIITIIAISLAGVITVVILKIRSGKNKGSETEKE
jgi:hypothetical protein